MERLIYQSSAYKIFCGDAEGGRLSHAYMLYFADERNLRSALLLFALKLFGESAVSRGGRLILSEGLSDLKVYPLPEKKLTAETASLIVEDAVKKPLEYDKKLYVISDFHNASAIFQNKLLKILEEPPAGVYFLLGTAALAPVLDTVKSRVKLLEIPPFTTEEILGALERKGANPLNGSAAESCGGILGMAEDMTEGGWYGEVTETAREICCVSTVGEAVAAASKYGDFKYKKELLTAMQREYFAEVKMYAQSPDYRGKLPLGAVVYAVERINGCLADLKFNANFPSLLYDFLLEVTAKA